MNRQDNKYAKFALVNEMFGAADVVKSFSSADVKGYVSKISHPRVLFSGEGSSRIFPAKRLIYDSLRYRYAESFVTESATQALEYDLTDYTVFVASNSGRTKEGVRLVRELMRREGAQVISVVGDLNSPIHQEAQEAYLMKCGGEKAVAASKSVVEQALFYDLLFSIRNNPATGKVKDLEKMAAGLETILGRAVSKEFFEPMIAAETIYFAGKNNGVAEELTLKTNEIVQKRSDLLEGTYALHGVEEVMKSGDVVIVVDPFKEEEEKFAEVLVKNLGVKVLAIADRPTSFPTFEIPESKHWQNYYELVAGWNLLVEAGIQCGVNIDQPKRARKIGNEIDES